MRRITWLVILCTVAWFMFLGPWLMPMDFARVGFPIFLLGMGIVIFTRKKNNGKQQ